MICCIPHSPNPVVETQRMKAIAQLGVHALYKSEFGVWKEKSVNLGQGTNNIGELGAIRLALDTIKETLQTQKTTTIQEKPKACIFTDSQYAIGVLSKNWKANANQNLIAELRQMLFDLELEIDISFQWIKGHAEIAGNERADALANQACKLPVVAS